MEKPQTAIHCGEGRLLPFTTNRSITKQLS